MKLVAIVESASDLMNASELAEIGFSEEQIKYLLAAEKLVKSKQAKSVDDIEDLLSEQFGYGVVDKAVLEDNWFKH